MSIGKGADTQSNAEVISRKEEIEKFLVFVADLKTTAKTVEDDSEEVKNLLHRIRGLEKDVKKLDQVKENKTKFAANLKNFTARASELSKEVANTKYGLMPWQVEKENLKKQRESSAEALALEKFNKSNADYRDAQERLDGFLGFLKKYNLETGKEELAEQLRKNLSKIKDLLDNKEYADLKNQYDKFVYKVSGLLSKAYDAKEALEEPPSATTAEPVKGAESPAIEPVAATPAPPAVEPASAARATFADLKPRVSQRTRKEKGVVPKKLVPSLGMRKTTAPEAKEVSIAEIGEEQKTAAYENGVALHKENKDKFLELVKNIKNLDAKLNKKGAFFRSFQPEMDILAVSLRKNYELSDKDEFDANIKSFSDTYKQAKERLEDERAKVEIKPIEKKQDIAATTAKEDEPAVQKTAEEEAAEQEQRYLQRIKCEDDFLLLIKIIRDADQKEKSHKLFDAASKELAVLKSYLTGAKAANNPDKLNLAGFNSNINKFNEAVKKLVADLGPGIKEAFEQGGLPVTAAAEASESKSVVNKKEHDQRKLLCEDRWASVTLLEKAIGDVKDYHARLEPVKDYLKKAFVSLDNDEDFNKSISEFTDAFNEVLLGLPPEAQTAFAQGGSKKAVVESKVSEEQEKRKFIHDKLSADLRTLEEVIKTKVKNKPIGYFEGNLAKLKEYLSEAHGTNKKFEDNIRAFNRLLLKTAEEVEAAATESKKITEAVKPLQPSEVLPTTPDILQSAPIPPAEAPEPLERKKRILDISERDLLEIVGEKKLQEVVNEIILGNADVAKVLMKDIFSRKDIDLEHLNKVLEKFGYTPARFMKKWAETLHARAFEAVKQWVEQMSRNWLNNNIKWWEKLKANPMAHAKLAAVNILPFAALGGSIGVLVASGGVSNMARGAVVGGATGLLRGLKAKIGGVRGWFEKRKEKAREEIVVGEKKIKEEKATPLRDALLAQFTGENGPEMMEQLSAMLSQSLRDASAAEITNEAIDKLKSGASAAVEEISEKIEVEFEAMKITAGEETAKEVQRSQTERAETLIKKLYEDKDLEALIQKVIERDPKIVNKLRGLKINNLEFDKFIKEEDKDPVKKESNARKAAAILASVAAGASIGGALASAPELRAVLGAVAGGYLGVKYGHLKNRKDREARFEKEFKDSVSKAEKAIEQWERRRIKEPVYEPTLENVKELAERAKDLRAPLTLGMLAGDINLNLRAQNALRRLESLQINLYINQNPLAEEKAIPEEQRNRGVEKLLIGLNSELEDLTKEQQDIEQRILQKPNWWRVVGYGVVGAVAGAGLGYGAAKLQEHIRGHHKLPSHSAGEDEIANTAAPAPEYAGVHPEPVGAIEHADQKPEAIAVLPQARQIDVVTLDDSEGVLHGGNKLMRLHPELFKHDDGKLWTPDEIHKWKVDELKEMGFKFKGDKWGYPMTVHGGAQVELFTDADGRPHFKLASEEHVTFNKYYKWVDTAPSPAKAGAVESLSKDDLINPYPESHEIKTDVESIADHAQIAPADMAVERATMPKPARVDLDIKEKAIVHHAPAAAPAHPAGGPEAAEVKETVSQFLTERGSNPKEFVWVYDKMVDSAIDQVKDKLIFQGNAAEFLQGKINALYNARMTPENITSFNPSDSRSLAMVEKILDAENKFKLNQSDWLKSFSQTMFDKSDKAMRLALAPDRDVLLEPIKTNGGHAARIWDPAEGKDVFIYDKDRVFNTNDDGRLIVKDEYGVTRLFSQKQALKMAEKP